MVIMVDIAGGHQRVAIAVVWAERDTALGIARGDHKQCGFDELVFQLRDTGGRAARAEWRIDFLEHDTLSLALAEFVKDLNAEQNWSGHKTVRQAEFDSGAHIAGQVMVYRPA